MSNPIRNFLLVEDLDPRFNDVQTFSSTPASSANVRAEDGMKKRLNYRKCHCCSEPSWREFLAS